MRNRRRLVLLALTLQAALPPASASAQTIQYRAASGATYLSQPDTGPIARAERALAADPRSADRLLDLGLAQSGVRQYREAIETFTRALALAPNDARLFRWRGHRYLSVREFDRAMADLLRGAQLDSTMYGIWYHLGVVRYVRGDFSGAADAFARALPRAPDGGELAGSTDWLWMSLQRAGRRAEAQAVLARRPDTIPTTAAYVQRLKLYRGEIGPDAVIGSADTSDVAVATLSYGVGDWYLLRGDTAKARAWFERSVSSGGWPAFGFIASEAELRRLGAGARIEPRRSSRARREKPRMLKATGTFEVKLTPQWSDDAAGAGPPLGRLSLLKTFRGDLEATSLGEMLSAGTPASGSAGYVAMERVTGTLGGRHGSFALQHSGSMDAGALSLTITVVPGSGTEGLKGLTGSMSIDASGGKHAYALTYSLASP